ncbi:hypothetical protein FZEAL_5480 [Fusarium zealandicum]|uniref:Uncharacterized protein n=1 Tax=Fusarium zealandicum TaxID=1053134 RepID=A0A8H4UK36_9HYPO|nr:hypothetical protein FZEAL_5480 [Fusarium zealandicum]
MTKGRETWVAKASVACKCVLFDSGGDLAEISKTPRLQDSKTSKTAYSAHQSRPHFPPPQRLQSAEKPTSHQPRPWHWGQKARPFFQTSRYDMAWAVSSWVPKSWAHSPQPVMAGAGRPMAQHSLPALMTALCQLRAVAATTGANSPAPQKQAANAETRSGQLGQRINAILVLAFLGTHP